MSAETEWAWAAGFYDGEGCMCFQKYTDGTQVALMVVAQTNREVLERFQRAVGGGGIYGPRRQQAGWKLRWDWRTTKKAAIQTALSRMWPYLCEPKRDQAKRILAGEIRNPPVRWPLGKKHTEEEKAKMRAAWARRRAEGKVAWVRHGEEIRALRREGLTHRSIARQLGISHSTVGKSLAEWPMSEAT